MASEFIFNAGIPEDLAFFNLAEYRIGTSNDKPALDQAITDAENAGGGIVWAPPVSLAMTAGDGSPVIELKENVQIWGAPGSKFVFNQHSPGDHSTFSEPLIRATGTKSGSTALTADASAMARTISVTSASGYSENDWVIVSDDTTIDGQERGGLHQIESISGNDVTLQAGLRWAVETAENAKMELITPMRGVGLRGLEIQGNGLSQLSPEVADDWGVLFMYCEMPFIERCFVYDCDNTAIGFTSCIAPTARDNQVRGADNNTQIASNQYGIKFGAATIGGLATGNFVTGCKHGILTGDDTASGSPGLPYGIKVLGNRIVGCWDHAMMVHKANQDVAFDNNVVIGGAGGCEIRAPFVSCRNNDFYNVAEEVIFITRRARHVDIIGNKIKNAGQIGNSPISSKQGILLNDMDSGELPLNINIKLNQIYNAIGGVTISDTDSTTLRTGLNIEANSIHDVEDAGIKVTGAFSGRIANNLIDGTGVDAIELNGVRYTDIVVNTIRNAGGNGIDLDDQGSPSITADYNVIERNTVAGYSGSAVNTAGASGGNNVVGDNNDLGSTAPS